jgi:hypothetical protein
VEKKTIDLSGTVLQKEEHNAKLYTFWEKGFTNEDFTNEWFLKWKVYILCVYLLMFSKQILYDVFNILDTFYLSNCQYLN